MWLRYMIVKCHVSLPARLICSNDCHEQIGMSQCVVLGRARTVLMIKMPHY